MEVWGAFERTSHPLMKTLPRPDQILAPPRSSFSSCSWGVVFRSFPVTRSARAAYGLLIFTNRKRLLIITWGHRKWILIVHWYGIWLGKKRPWVRIQLKRLPWISVFLCFFLFFFLGGGGGGFGGRGGLNLQLLTWISTAIVIFSFPLVFPHFELFLFSVSLISQVD